VLTILNKFFEIIDPNIVIFGKKDYQQFIMVRDFINNNNLNIKIIGGNTVRESSGLALSSRNNLLSTQEKLIAAKLYEVLSDIESNKNNLNTNFINSKKDYLESYGIKVDYLTTCDPKSLEESYEINNKDLLVAIAAYVGKVRLIDNLIIRKL
jgi:pantoate--beta-alanine ligase